VPRPKKLKISTKLMLLLAPYACCVTAFALIGFQTLATFQVGGPIYRRVIQAKDVIADVLPPPEYIIESYLLTLRMADESDPEALAELIERSKGLRRDYDARHEFWVGDLDAGRLRDVLVQDSYHPAIEFFDVRDRELVPALLAGDRAKVKELVHGKLLDHYEKHRNAVDEVVRIATEQNQSLEQEVVAIISRKSRLLSALGIGISLITAAVFLVSWRFASDLTSRIGQAAAAAQKVASGDLTLRIEKATDDEVGALFLAIATMTESLSSLVSKVKRSSVEIMSTATEMGATGKEQEGTIQGLGRSTNEIAAAVKEISATGQELLSTMDGVNMAAVGVASVATEGRKGLEGMDTTMRQLADATTSISARLSAIREKASDINLVVTTITKVADQTNLLSVNAAIEAEKAGESGLGFLVLAREIRRLADQTAVATLDIDRMVREMQGAVSAGVMEMDKFSEEVRSGAGSVAEIGEQLGAIIEQVETISLRFVSVNEGMRTQALGATHIDLAMVEVVDVTRKSMGSVVELDGAIGQLRSAVAELDAGIACFTLSH
jgi:methyl-accepting chemotaxis protein WspA